MNEYEIELDYQLMHTDFTDMGSVFNAVENILNDVRFNHYERVSIAQELFYEYTKEVEGE